MSEANLYRCNARQIRNFAMDCIEAGLVPYIQSSPGMGKSAIVKSIAEDFKLKLIDHRLSTSAPEDMTGLPRFSKEGFAHFSPFADLFPVEGTPIPDGCEGWLLFLDEFPSAPRSVQAAAYKLILDKMVGQHKLHPNVVIVCAGNLMTDKAIVNNIGTAMQSRLVHLEMEINVDVWMQDVALVQNYDKRIIAFIAQNGSKLMDFNPDHHDKTFCCPRTWEFINKLLKKNPTIDESRAALFAGTITSGTAAEFIQFTKVFDDLIKIKDILDDPANCKLPRDNSISWATITTMMEAVNEKNFDKLAEYANRFSITFKILFYRSILARNKDLRKHSAFTNAAVELTRYLND